MKTPCPKFRFPLCLPLSYFSPVEECYPPLLLLIKVAKKLGAGKERLERLGKIEIQIPHPRGASDQHLIVALR